MNPGSNEDRLGPAAKRISECGASLEPSDPAVNRSTGNVSRGRPVVCFFVGLIAGGSLLWLGHALTVVWTSLGGPTSALLTASMTAVFVAVASVVRHRLYEAVALASGAALGLVGMFVVGNWLIAGQVFTPRPWVLWSLVVLLVAYGLTGAVAAATSRAIARRSTRARSAAA